MADEPLPLLPHEERLPPRRDLLVAAAFFAFGAAILSLCLRMPNYLDQGGQLYTAPALVPGLYGIVILVLSGILGWRAIAAGALSERAPAAADESGNSTARLAIAAGLGLLFIVGLIGRMPFWLATAIFVALFIGAFEWRPGQAGSLRARILAIAAVQGLATGWAVTLVFEKLFLVRLP
jgi:putative tricarboxylic transport membrane protein